MNTHKINEPFFRDTKITRKMSGKANPSQNQTQQQKTQAKPNCNSKT